MNKKYHVFSLALCASLPLMLSASPSSQVASSANSQLDLFRVFQGAPVIYTLLIAMSIFASVLWLYSMVTFKIEQLMPEAFIKQLRSLFAEKRYEAALQACKHNRSFSSKVMISALEARNHGSQAMTDTIHSEGRRMGSMLWQRISLLSDIATIAPMFGLLGTVIGMFYAFYDTSQSSESLVTIFDGLGVAVGTTVAGLIVAILAMVFYTTLKYRVVKLLNAVEDEALALGALIIEKTSPSN
jgi:biopolymer transport protein ExbB